MNSLKKNSKSPLILAVENFDEEAIEALLKAEGKDKFSKMFVEDYPDEDQVVEFLNKLRTKYANDRSLADRLFELNFPLPYVIYLKNKHVVARMLDLDSSVHTIIHGNATSIHIAASLADLGLIKLLVDCGASIQALDKDLRPPLDYFLHSIYADTPEASRILEILAKDKNLFFKKDIYGSCPILTAVARGNKDIVKTFIKLYPNLFNTNGLERQPLFHLIGNPNPGVFNMLRKTKNLNFNVRFQDSYGNTALHHACMIGNMAAIQFLIAHNIDVHIKNSSGETALMIAKDEEEEYSRQSYKKCVNILKAAANKTTKRLV